MLLETLFNADVIFAYPPDAADTNQESLLRARRRRRIWATFPCILACPTDGTEEIWYCLLLSPSKLQEWIKKFFILPPQWRVSQAGQTNKLNILGIEKSAVLKNSERCGIEPHKKSTTLHELLTVSYATCNQTLNVISECLFNYWPAWPKHSLLSQTNFIQHKRHGLSLRLPVKCVDIFAWEVGLHSRKKR